MKRAVAGKIVVRLLMLGVGFVCLRWVLYLAGIGLVPLTDPWDKAVLAACNPDHYVPVLDEFIRALTDYTNFLIVAPILSWLIARGLFRLFPRFKMLFVGILASETVILAVLAALGKLWPNKTYVGVNIIEVIAILAAFGLVAFLFYKLDGDAMRCLSVACGLALLSGTITDFGITNPIKKAVARPRPLNDANKPWNEQVRVIPDELQRGNNSFPSGHTSGTFALLTPLFWFTRDRRVRAGLLTWATLQGFSRVYTAAHFPFCCLMGGLLGFSMGTLVFFVLGGRSLWKQPEPDLTNPPGPEPLRA